MRDSYSLAGRLQLVIGGLLLFTLGTVGIVLDRFFVMNAERAVVERLELHLHTLLAAADTDESGLSLPNYLDAQQFNRIDSGLYAMVLNANGEIEWASSSIRNTKMFLKKSHGRPPQRGEQMVVKSNDSIEPLFVMCYGAAWDNGGELDDYVVLVAESMEPYRRSIESYRYSLWTWLSGAGLFLLLVQILVMRWVLNPLRKIVNDLTDIQEGRRESLGDNSPKELASLIESVNDLVDYEAKQKEYYRNNLANLAHSLKTPLAVLRTAIFERNLNDVREDLSLQVDSLNQLVSYQLQRSIIPSGKLMSKPVSLLITVNKLRRTLDKVYADKTIKITVDISENDNFYGDEHDLFEVLGNLMENACKYTSSQVVVSTATTKSHRKKKQCCIVVEDDGAGIPQDEVDSALSRGVRLDSQSHGQGIGLAMVADLVEGYKGEINIEASSLGGCRFIVVI